MTATAPRMAHDRAHLMIAPRRLTALLATTATHSGRAGPTSGEAAAPRNAALTSASAEVTWLNGPSLAATFDGEFYETSRSYAGKGVVRYAR